jgi:hypothetical protein
MKSISTYIKLQLAVTYSKLKADVSYTKLASKIGYAKLQATIVYTKLNVAATAPYLTVSIQYVLLKVASVVGQFIAYLEFFETVNLTDASIISVGKNLVDDINLQDQFSSEVTLNKQESVSTVDSAIFTAGLNKTDSVNLQDQVSVIAVSKQLDDTAEAVDLHSIAFTKFLTDIVSSSDTLAGIVFTDEQDDSVVVDDFPVTDDPELTIGKNLLDTTTASDAGLLVMQDYCDITYFLEDYVGTSRTF